MPKYFVVPNNDAESYAIQQILKKRNIEYDITGLPWGATTESLEEDIKEKINEHMQKGDEVYVIELNGDIPGTIKIDHHNYGNKERTESRPTSIEQVSKIVGHTMTDFEHIIAANDVGFIPGMIEEARRLNLKEEDRIRYIGIIDKLESAMKIPYAIGQSRLSIDDIPRIWDIHEKEYSEYKRKAKEAVDDAYVYDERFAWIDIDNFDLQRHVSFELYSKGKENKTCYENFVISSSYIDGNHRFVFFGKKENTMSLNELFKNPYGKWMGGKEPNTYFGIQVSKNIDLDKKENLDELIEIIVKADTEDLTIEEKFKYYDEIIELEDNIENPTLSNEKEQQLKKDLTRIYERKLYDVKIKVIEEKMRTHLEEKLLGYHPILKKEDIIETENTDKYGSRSLKIHEVKKPEAFRKAIAAAQNENSHASFVHVYDADEYAGRRMFVVNAGCAGCIVTPTGDIESVFKNDKMAKSDNVEKISTALLLTAINAGGQKLDCYDGFLVRNYMNHGFIPVARVKFDDRFAENWNYERDGRPDVVFLIHNGDTPDVIQEKRKEHAYDGYDETKVNEIMKNVPYYPDYDTAAAARDKLLEKEKVFDGPSAEDYLFSKSLGSELYSLFSDEEIKEENTEDLEL